VYHTMQNPVYNAGSVGDFVEQRVPVPGLASALARLCRGSVQVVFL